MYSGSCLQEANARLTLVRCREKWDRWKCAHHPWGKNPVATFNFPAFQKTEKSACSKKLFLIESPVKSWFHVFVFPKFSIMFVLFMGGKILSFVSFQCKESPLVEAVNLKIRRYDIVTVLLDKGAHVSIDTLKKAIIHDNQYVILL